MEVKLLIRNSFIIILCFVIYFVINLIDIQNFRLYSLYIAFLIIIDFIISISTYFITFTYTYRIFLLLISNEKEERNQYYLNKKK